MFVYYSLDKIDSSICFLFIISMLKKLKQFFPSSTDDDSNAVESLQLAAATLMVEVLSADSVVDEREVQHSLKLLANRFNLQQNDLDELFNTAREKSDEAISLHSFTREICDQLDNIERVKLLAMLWEIALVDNELDANERHLIRKIASLLYLNDKQIIQAKELAKQALT